MDYRPEPTIAAAASPPLFASPVGTASATPTVTVGSSTVAAPAASPVSTTAAAAAAAAATPFAEMSPSMQAFLRRHAAASSLSTSASAVQRGGAAAHLGSPPLMAGGPARHSILSSSMTRPPSGTTAPHPNLSGPLDSSADVPSRPVTRSPSTTLEGTALASAAAMAAAAAGGGGAGGVCGFSVGSVFGSAMPPLALSEGLCPPPLQPLPLPLPSPPPELVPPHRFALVEEGVFRGAYPVLRNFPFLETLRLRTIVQLTPEEPTYDLAAFAAAHGIAIRHIQAERFKGEAQLLPNHLSAALQVLIDAEQHPVYLHCLDGRHVAGLVVMALRKLLGWDIAANDGEYRRFAKSTDDEVAFITDYTGPLTVPPRVPQWLWGGSSSRAAAYYGAGRPGHHTQIKLRFTTPPPPQQQQQQPQQHFGNDPSPPSSSLGPHATPGAPPPPPPIARAPSFRGLPLPPPSPSAIASAALLDPAVAAAVSTPVSATPSAGSSTAVDSALTPGRLRPSVHTPPAHATPPRAAGPPAAHSAGSSTATDNWVAAPFRPTGAGDAVYIDLDALLAAPQFPAVYSGAAGDAVDGGATAADGVSGDGAVVGSGGGGGGGGGVAAAVGRGKSVEMGEGGGPHSHVAIVNRGGAARAAEEAPAAAEGRSPVEMNGGGGSGGGAAAAASGAKQRPPAARTLRSAITANTAQPSTKAKRRASL